MGKYQEIHNDIVTSMGALTLQSLRASEKRYKLEKCSVEHAVAEKRAAELRPHFLDRDGGRKSEEQIRNEGIDFETLQLFKTALTAALNEYQNVITLGLTADLRFNDHYDNFLTSKEKNSLNSVPGKLNELNLRIGNLEKSKIPLWTLVFAIGSFVIGAPVVYFGYLDHKEHNKTPEISINGLDLDYEHK